MIQEFSRKLRNTAVRLHGQMIIRQITVEYHVTRLQWRSRDQITVDIIYHPSQRNITEIRRHGTTDIAGITGRKIQIERVILYHSGIIFGWNLEVLGWIG